MRPRNTSLTIIAVVALVVGLLVPSAATADVVLMKDGRRLEGKIVDVLADGTVLLDARYGTLHLPAGDIVSYERGETEWERLEREAKDAAAALTAEAKSDEILNVANLCREADLDAEAQKLVDRILKTDPDHELTRHFLGQVQHEGAWVDKAVALRAKAKEGEGDWLTATEAEERAAKKEEKREARRLKRLERDVKRNFERLYSNSQKRADYAHANLIDIALDEELPEIRDRAADIMGYTDRVRKLHRESSYTTLDIRATLFFQGDLQTVNVNLGTIGRAAVNVPIELPGGKRFGVGTSVGAPGGS